MNWFKRLQNVFAYIEDHLLEDLDSKMISKNAFTSEFHFQRMFYAITDMSLWDYIRKRRLTLAASKLLQSDQKIIDIALEFGYESPESFSRAFKKIHGVSPSQVRKEGKTLVAYPPLSIQISIKGDQQMEYRLEKKESFTIKGISKKVSTENEENFKVIPRFWDQVLNDGTFEKMMETSESKISYGVCTEFDESSKSFIYSIGVDDFGQNSYESILIPASTWAIFTSTGKLPLAIQSLTKRIYKEWFPATNFKHDSGPELEVYLPGDPSKAEYQCEVWIPVVNC